MSERQVASVARLQRRLQRSSDTGISLVELLVTMAIMSIVMAIFTTGIVQMCKSANRTDARANAQSQISLALARLDKQVRYAAGIGQPYLVGPVQYVEILVTGTAKADCVQLRVFGGQLQQRTWKYQTTPVQPTSWTTLASGLTSSQPFSYLPVSDAVAYQRLRVQLKAVSGGGAAQVAKDSDITFTALNTTRETGTDACDEGKTLP